MNILRNKIVRPGSLKFRVNRFSNLINKNDVAKAYTNNQVIDNDYGLRLFLNKTYKYTEASIVGSILSGVVLSHNPELLEYSLHMIGGGFVTGILSIFSFHFSKHEVKNKKVNYITYYYSVNSFSRKLSYFSIIGSMSMVCAPVIAEANITGILEPAILMTTLVFGGAIQYAKTRKEGELSSWGPALYGGLLGLIGCGFSSLGAQLIFGPNEFSTIMQSIDIYVGIPIFAGLVAYDTHEAIGMYQNGNPDHLNCSLALYLDFMNLIIKMIRLLERIRNTNEDD